ncbi:MAG: hypothetical protein FWE57_04835 [Chitinispirillia bacterium]|nr:hypothetical protein [Chitinispirillia bacterium]
MNYELNKSYFFPVQNIVAKRKRIGFSPIFAIITGILLLWSGIVDSEQIKTLDPSTEEVVFPIIQHAITLWEKAQEWFYIGGFAAIGIGVIWITLILVFNVKAAQKAKKFNESRIIVTDSEIDGACEEYLNDNFKLMALKKLGFEENQVREIESIQFSGYFYDDLKTSEWVLKAGADGKHRSSHYAATLFFWFDKQVYCFQHIFSLLEEGVKQEVTWECFYQDIISVSMRSSTIKRKSNGDTVLVNVEELILTTSGGVTMSTPISDSENAELSVQKIKKLFKDKKTTVIGNFKNEESKS